MHTKGPLTAEYSNVYRVTKNEAGKVDARVMVADCISGIHLSYEEAKANAVLFAEAPAMLEVLQELCRVNELHDVLEKNEFINAYNNAQEVIRKVRGK